MNANVKTLPARPARTGTRIAIDLRESEHLLDHSLMAMMQLGRSMIDGRLKQNLAAGVGHDALQELSQSISTAVACRTSLVRAHDILKQTADDHGIVWTAEGPLEFKPKGSATQDEQAA